MGLVNFRVSLNGKQGKYDNGVRQSVEQFVRRELGYSDDYDVIININAKRLPAVIFKPGDIYQYRFNSYGQWYTYVRGIDGWTGDMTDDKMRVALIDGLARKCVATPV
jgi:hypothetical protein